MAATRQISKSELSPGEITHSVLKELVQASDGSKLFPNGIDHLELEFGAGAAKGFTLGLKAWGPTTSPKEENNERAFLSTLSTLDLAPISVEAAVRYASSMENIAAPKMTPDPADPKRGKVATSIVAPTGVPSLKSVADFWTDSCTGGDQYENNCAHFLSDAFIRAGYTTLLPSAACINARCSTAAARPIRARDMWCWFQSMATKKSTQLTRGTGWWAAFQLDETVYWGGHVVLFDSDNWKWYGTGWYPKWNQFLYQW